MYTEVGTTGAGAGAFVGGPNAGASAGIGTETRLAGPQAGAGVSGASASASATAGTAGVDYHHVHKQPAGRPDYDKIFNVRKF